MRPARVVAVHRSGSHSFSKHEEEAITLVAGLGIEGDAHAGTTVRHRSRVRRDASQPNLRQVHLLHAELFDELVARDFAVFAGDLGENITTAGVDLLGLSQGTRLRIGREAVVELTGLREPCSQLDRFLPGLMAAVLDRAPDGELVRKAGVMGVVLQGGIVRAGDAIVCEPPPPPWRKLAPV